MEVGEITLTVCETTNSLLLLGSALTLFMAALLS